MKARSIVHYVGVDSNMIGCNYLIVLMQKEEKS